MGGGRLKATRGSAFSSFVRADLVDLISFSCFWGVVIVISPIQVEHNVKLATELLLEKPWSKLRVHIYLNILASPFTGLICLAAVPTRDFALALMESMC
jgi:hypothetical protein